MFSILGTASTAAVPAEAAVQPLKSKSEPVEKMKALILDDMLAFSSALSLRIQPSFSGWQTRSCLEKPSLLHDTKRMFIVHEP